MEPRETLESEEIADAIKPAGLMETTGTQRALGTRGDHGTNNLGDTMKQAGPLEP